MFRKLFKKKNTLVILHQEEGVSGNAAKEAAEQMKTSIGCKVTLIPYGYSLEKINSKWVLTENGKSRYGRCGFSKQLIDEIQTQLGTDVILVRYGLNIGIHDI